MSNGAFKQDYPCVYGNGWTTNDEDFPRSDYFFGYFKGYEPIKLTVTSATDAWAQYLTGKYGAGFSTSGRRLVRCSKEQIWTNDDGFRETYCEAQFKAGRTWRHVTGSVTEDGSNRLVVDSNWSRKWQRRWHRPAGCTRNWRDWRVDTRRVSIWSNNGGCYGDILGDIQRRALKTGGASKFSAWNHGTGTAVYPEIYRYRCRKRNHAVTCTNDMGDAFRFARK
jgi:hypothetical protein